MRTGDTEDAVDVPPIPNNFPVTNIKSYVSGFIGMYYDMVQRSHIRSDDWLRTIKVNVGNQSAMDFNTTAGQLAMMAMAGERATERFLEKK
jgi:hypothetical protein